MALPPGTRLGPYEITSQIGVGGMGEVYQATDTNLKRQAAIKVLPALVAADAERLARFRREAEVLAALNHPNIAHIYGLERSVGTLALAMELVEGPTLADRIAHGALPVDEALPIAKQIADALEAAHEQGIIHRDLKPANIKVRADGTVKVLDFGLAKALAPSGANATLTPANSPTITSPAMTEMGMILGTAAYMSPEQARGRDVDTRADIWAFGVVLFEMLTGRPLFPGETVTDMLAAVLTQEIDWSRLPVSMPPGVVRLLRRCLERDVRRRLRDIGDARWDLDDTAMLPNPAASLPLQAPSKGATGGSARLLGLTAGALALAIAATAWTWSTSTSTPGNQEATYFEAGFPREAEPLPLLGPGFGISPDGRRLFMAGSRGGARHLLLRSLNDLETAELADPDNIAGATFSPDGASLALLRVSGRVETLSLRDSLRVTLANDGDQSGAITWGEAGIIYASNGALRLVKPEGGDPRTVTTINGATGEVLHSDAVTMPGGRTLAFAVQTRDGSGDRIEAVDLATGARTVVVEGASTPIWSPTGHLLFERNGAVFAAPFNPTSVSVTGPAVLVIRAGSIAFKNSGGLAMRLSTEGSLAYVSATFGRTHVVSVSRDGAATDLELPPGVYAQPRVAPNQRQLLVNRDTSEMLVVDAARGSTTRIGPPAHGVNYGTWVANGQRVAMRVFNVLNIAAPDGSGTLTPVPGAVVNDYPSGPGPDADSLLVTRVTPRQSGDVYVFSLSGAYAPKPLVTSPGYDGGATLSPDGRWMLYFSTMSGQGEVYVARFPDVAHQWQVSVGGGRQVRWSGDGREIYYRSNGKFIAATFNGAGAEPVIGKPSPLFTDVYDFGTAISLATYDVTSDGRFIVTKREDTASALQVVSHWTAELTRILAAGGLK